MKNTLLILATTLAFHVSALAQTKVPSLINYQGYVANSAGVPIGNGAPENRTITFRFWKSASDTAAASRLYSESQTVTVLTGDFSVLIGNGAAVDGETNAVANVAGVFANKEVFLGITVDDGNPTTTDAEITPRQQLVSTAFAFRATVAESVDNGAISNAMLDANAVNTDQLVASSVTNDKMAASSVTSANIVDGTITKADIGANAVEADEIAANAITTVKIADGSVTLGKIAANAVDSSKIVNGTVTGTDILNGTISLVDLAANAVDSSKIVDNSITGSDILNGTITSFDISSNAVDSSKIVDGSVTASDLGANTVTANGENLRIIRGTVKGTGQRWYGQGYTVTKVAGQTGLYVITFTTPFSSSPSITTSITGRIGLYAEVYDKRTTWPIWPSDNLYPGADGFTVGVLDTNRTTGYNYGFSFIAVGPR